MIKTKKNNVHKPLVIAGYILFSLLLVATLVSTTIPLGIALFNPRVMHFNVTVMIIAFTVGSILPVLLGYIIGDHAVKTKSKLRHHFTGMLFGLLAYWVMMLLSVFITLPSEFHEANRNVSLMIVNILPSIGVAVLAVILSVAHVRSRHAKQDILGYKPFTIVLIVSIIGLPLWSLIQNVMINSVSLYSFVPLILVVMTGLISYATLRKARLKKLDKLAWSAVSVSVLFVAMYVLPQFVSTISNYLLKTPTMETMALVSWIGFILALAGWSVYWFNQVKALR